MASKRLKGNTVPVFSLSNLTGSPSAWSGAEDLISVNLGEGDQDQTTFGDFATGDGSFAIEVTGVYSGDTGGLYDVLWRNAGKAGVTFIWGPHGNSTASAGKPVYTGTCTLGPKPALETEASAADPVQFEVTIQIDTITRTAV